MFGSAIIDIVEWQRMVRLHPNRLPTTGCTPTRGVVGEEKGRKND